MSGKIYHYVYAILNIVYSDAIVYYHKASLIEITPSERTDGADFGFSLAYQGGVENRLVVGSPHGDLSGQVFGCPIRDVLNKTTECSQLPIDIDSLAPHNRDKVNPTQNFCLGTSISATPDYFVVSAPLWSTWMSGMNKYGPVGTCFVYHNATSVQRYRGLIEQVDENSNYDAIVGGVGISTLYDEKNKLLLFGKPYQYGDITYVSSLDPTSDTKSLSVSRDETKKTIIANHKKYLFDLKHISIGYALAAGNFFSDDILDTVYAFTLEDTTRKGKVGDDEIGYNDLESFMIPMTLTDSNIGENNFRASLLSSMFKIAFLKYNKDEYELTILKKKEGASTIVVEVSAPDIGTMFGASMSSADLNADSVAELMIGAPAQAISEDGFETGALYILIGGDMENVNRPERMRTIYGKVDGSRFGTAVAASDIDGDGLPELFITAPYEDQGIGALYILPGFELKTTLMSSDRRSVFLSDLTNVQRIQHDTLKSFGYSLQIVPDADGNGCSELALGSPNSARVVLLRCIPAINATISANLLNQFVKEYDTNFTVHVCVNVSYQPKPFNISTKLSVNNIVKGYAKIENPTFDIRLEDEGKEQCENIVVKLDATGTGFYEFTSRLESNENIIEEKDFKNTWVTLSLSSITQANIIVTRHCSKLDDCTPKLQISMLFAERQIESYVLGSKDSELLTIMVHNNGVSVYDSCVRLRIVGARVSMSQDCGLVEAGRLYECHLPQPLQRNHNYTTNLLLNISRSSHLEHKISVEAYLYNNCQNTEATNHSIDITLMLTGDNVHLSAESPNLLNITDAIVASPGTIGENHEYTITNDGTVLWDNLTVIIEMDRKPFICNSTVSVTRGKNCTNKIQETSNKIEFFCTFDLMPHSKTKIVVTTNIIKDKIAQHAKKGQLEIVSKLVLPLDPISEVKNQSVKTTIYYQETIGVGNNKTLVVIIAAVVAAIVLCICAYVLFKLGFFKRKQKEELETFKKNIRKQSIKPSTSSQYDQTKRDSHHDDDIDDVQIEVDDSPFDNQEETSTAVAVDNPAFEPDHTPAHPQDDNCRIDKEQLHT